MRDNADPPLEEAQTTLAETLLARGFRTRAFVGSVVLDPDRGLKQGFEHYRGVDGVLARHGARQRRADQVIADAVHWLDTIDGTRFFLGALYDPHRPYDPPEPYASIYGHNLYVGESRLPTPRSAGCSRRSSNGLSWIDDRHRRWRPRRIAGVHGERDHGVFIYENVLRVPLIVRAPGLPPFRVGEVVRLTDVMPTVLDLLDVPALPVEGISLVDLMRGRRRDLNLEAYSDRCIRSGLGGARYGRCATVDQADRRTSPRALRPGARPVRGAHL